MTVAEILAAFPGKSALVVGDICLDRWCTYDPSTSEPSRETGIPRIGVVSTEVTPGAGGTVSNNLAALGLGRIAVLGAIGEDGFGYELTQALAARRVSSDLLVRSTELATFTYTKVINGATGEEDQPRLDFINTRPLPESVERELVSRLREVAAGFDVIFVSDQAETARGGCITPALRDVLSEIAGEKLVWVDSRLRSGEFRKAVLKPNDQEAARTCTDLFGGVDYRRLLRHADSGLMFVTHGSRGVLVVEENSETLIPTRAVDKPVDICGAGDSFSAGAAVALAITGSAIEAARFGNLVASITIMKKGTGTANPAEVLRAAGE